MHFVARRLFNSHSLSLPHTQPCGHFPFSHTFTVHTHHCACMGHTASTRDAAQCHELSRFCWPALLLRQRSFSYFVRFCHTSRPTSIARQLIHAHTHTHRQQQRSRRQALPIQTHKAFRAVSLACSLSLALSRCVFSLSSLKVKEEGCRCRCRSRRWQRAASRDRRSRLQLSQRTKLSDHCNVGR